MEQEADLEHHLSVVEDSLTLLLSRKALAQEKVSPEPLMGFDKIVIMVTYMTIG